MHFPGIDDHDFIRGNIPMTKREIRILTLAQAKIRPDSVVIDIGAGTGSLSIEAALTATEGKVYAIEHKEEGVALMHQNTAKWPTGNLEVILGEAPEALAGLPHCDVILIGGSGQKLGEILDTSDDLLIEGGRIVINTVTVETLYRALEHMEKKKNYICEAFQAQVNRLLKTGPYHMAQANNPIAIITCTKFKKE